MNSANFTAWLYRPYLDLSSPDIEAPLHTHGVEFDYLNLQYDLKLPRIQSVLMPSFRAELVRESRVRGYAVDDPFSMSEEKSSDRWNLFCGKLRDLPQLEKNEQARVLWLLNKLCFYQKTSSLEFHINIQDNADDTELAYIFALANYTLSLERNRNYTLTKFEEIATYAPVGSFAKVNASYQMVVQSVKHGYKLMEVEKWLPIHYENILEAADSLGEFNTTRMLSRYYRVAGFLPQMKNQFGEMTRIMQLAEDYARKLFDLAKTKGEYENFYEVAAREMIYPVFESRIKEALALNDYALAERRARTLVGGNPNEPRARLHLGQILIENGKIEEAQEEYLTAAELGPPGSEIALFMAGQCYQALGNNKAALRCFKRSLHYDPMGISALEALGSLDTALFSKDGGLSLIEKWAGESLVSIKQNLGSHNPLRDVQTYQKRQFEQEA